VRYTPSFWYVKHFLNLVFVVMVIRAIETDQADEVRTYRDRMWFDAHSRHSWLESPTGKLLLWRREGQISAALEGSRRETDIESLKLKGENLRLYKAKARTSAFCGTKFGRSSSLPPDAGGVMANSFGFGPLASSGGFEDREFSDSRGSTGSGRRWHPTVPCPGSKSTETLLHLEPA
jgi:hypothetical protein